MALWQEKNRGAALVAFDLTAKQSFSSFLPVAFHKLSNYEARSFFNGVIKQKGNCNFKSNPKTDEYYVSITYGCITFIDSFTLNSY